MILKCESCTESRIFPTFFDWLLFIPGPNIVRLTAIYTWAPPFKKFNLIVRPYLCSQFIIM